MHILELRYRVSFLFSGFVFASIIGFVKKDIILNKLLNSLPSNLFSNNDPSGQTDIGKATNIVFLEITEAFSTQIYMIFILALFVSLPLFWIQFWFFLAPGLYSNEQKFLGLIALSSCLLILGMVWITESFLLPKAWTFFLSFGDMRTLNIESWENNLSFLPSIALYWKLFLNILLAMSISSQFPIILILMIHWQWLKTDRLRKSRPWFILGFLIWGAILSPPDIFSQFFIFSPLFICYETIVFFTYCHERWDSITSSSALYY
jgi:sec-independent protein translocase protein TatC